MFCVINVTVLFLVKRTKNVPRHILAPAAVACDTYLYAAVRILSGAFVVY